MCLLQGELYSPISAVIYSLIKTQPQRGLAFNLHFKLLIMQSVMFNSQHISVSKDTLHSHVILRRPLEAKIASLLSLKDQKKKKERNGITHQRTSKAAVYYLPSLI